MNLDYQETLINTISFDLEEVPGQRHRMVIFLINVNVILCYKHPLP